MEVAVFWALTTISSMGLLLGLLFRVPALLLASMMVLLTIIAAGPFLQLPVQTIAIDLVELLFALQLSYFGGVLLREFWNRTRNHHARPDARLPDPN
jgi:hypothetical protein